MIPFLDFDSAVAKLKLGFQGYAEFKYVSHFFLVDSNGNRLSRIRRADWTRILEEVPCTVVSTKHADGSVTAVLKFNFAHTEGK